MKVDISETMRKVEQAMSAIAGGVLKTKSLYPYNFNGSDCTTVAELAAANTTSEFKAALTVLSNRKKYSEAAYLDAVSYVKGLQPSPPSNYSGVAVVLTFGEKEADQLVIYGGEKPIDMHITLGFFGNLDEFDGPEELLGVVKELAEGLEPFPVVFNGLCRFSGDNGKDPIVLTADSPMLEKIRRRLFELCEKVEIEQKSEHGYVPHCTLGYVDPDDPLPMQRWAPTTVRAVSVELWFGRRRISVLMGSNGSYGVTGYEISDESKDIYMGPGSLPRRRQSGNKRSELIERARRFSVRKVTEEKV